MSPPTKREVMLALLERSEARVHLDARRPGVLLPSKLLQNGHVRLDYGYRLQPAIADLQIDDQGIGATLSFGRAPFATFIPWAAVFLIADFDGNGAVWQEDIPTDLTEDQPQSRRDRQGARQRKGIALVEAAPPAPASADGESVVPKEAPPPPPSDGSTKKRPPYLRLVK